MKWYEIIFTPGNLGVDIKIEEIFNIVLTFLGWDWTCSFKKKKKKVFASEYLNMQVSQR